MKKMIKTCVKEEKKISIKQILAEGKRQNQIIIERKQNSNKPNKKGK